MNIKIKKTSMGYIIGAAILLSLVAVFFTSSQHFAASYPPVFPAPGAEIRYYGAIQVTGGAPWWLYDDGTLVVGGGNIANSVFPRQGPWHDYRYYIYRIIFSQPIVGFSALYRLFFELHQVVSIDGLSYIDTTFATNMSHMFANMSAIESLDLSSWDVGRVTRMSSMFSNTSSLVEINLSGWNTGNVIYMGRMFMNASSLVSLDLSGWDVGNVGIMESMFRNASSLVNLDLSNWNTRGLFNTEGMFRDAYSLVALDLSWWRGTTPLSRHMFYGATSLRKITFGETFRPFEFLEYHLPNVPINYYYSGAWVNIGEGTPCNPLGTKAFASAALFRRFDPETMAGTWVWQPQGEIHIIARGDFVLFPHLLSDGGACWRLYENGIAMVGRGEIQTAGWSRRLNHYYEYVTEIIFYDDNIAGFVLSGLFRDLSNLVNIEGLENLCTERTQSMQNMFRGASSLTSLNIAHWDTGNLMLTNEMFYGASALVDLDLSGWDTSNVEDMSNMFRDTNLTSLDISGWDTRHNPNMFGFFGFRFLSYSLRIISLGANVQLPNQMLMIPFNQLDRFTGYWQNIGEGTVYSPLGEHIIYWMDFPHDFIGATMADTWVWQPREEFSPPLVSLRQMGKTAEGLVEIELLIRSVPAFPIIDIANQIAGNPVQIDIEALLNDMPVGAGISGFVEYIGERTGLGRIFIDLSTD